MNLGGFRLKNNETIDSPIMKRDFLKLYHEQAADLNVFDQNIEFIVRENNKYYRISNAYLQYELTKGKDVAIAANRVLVDGDVNRLVINAYAYCFKEARLSTTGGSDPEHN